MASVGSDSQTRPEASQHAARYRAGFERFERPEVTMFQESCRSAQRASQTLPTGVQFHKVRSLCCWASELVDCSRRGTSKVGLRVGGGPRTSAAHASRSIPDAGSERDPTPPPDWAAELHWLQYLVAQLHQERSQPGPRNVVEVVQDLWWEIDVLGTGLRIFSGIRHHGRCGHECSHRMAAFIEEREMKRRQMGAVQTNISW